MWNYEKRLQFPVKIDCTSPAAAKVIITQLGGPDGIQWRKMKEPLQIIYRENV